jgi:hypothetical protein
MHKHNYEIFHNFCHLVHFQETNPRMYITDKYSLIEYLKYLKLTSIPFHFLEKLMNARPVPNILINSYIIPSYFHGAMYFLHTPLNPFRPKVQCRSIILKTNEKPLDLITATS